MNDFQNRRNEQLLRDAVSKAPAAEALTHDLAMLVEKYGRGIYAVLFQETSVFVAAVSPNVFEKLHEMAVSAAPLVRDMIHGNVSAGEVLRLNAVTLEERSQLYTQFATDCSELMGGRRG